MKSVAKQLVAGIMAMVPGAALANPACPVCTIAIGAALPLTRRIGVPDVVVGIWGGAFLAILGYWLIKFCDKRGWRWPGRNALILGLMVASIGFIYIGQVEYTPCQYFGIINIDPILLGTIMGAMLFIGSEKLYGRMRAKNNGHAHFPFEKVVLPVIVLAVASWLMTLC